MIKSLKYSSNDEKFKKSWEYQQKRLYQDVSQLREQNRELKVTLEEVRKTNQEQDEEVAAARKVLKDKEAVNQKLMKEVDQIREQIERFEVDKAKNAELARKASDSVAYNKVISELQNDGKYLSFEAV